MPPSSPPYYPPTAFYFAVTILPSGPGAGPGGPPPAPAPPGGAAADAAFQEVSGLDRTLEFEELNEGGENRYSYRVPKRSKSGNLVLKRGMVSIKSGLSDWAEATLTSTFAKPITRKTVLVKLLNKFGQPLIKWEFTHAYPVKWSTSKFNSTASEIAVESIELAYAGVERSIVGNQEGFSQ